MPKIRAYLLKDSVETFEDAIRADDSGNLPPTLTIRDGLGVEGVVYYKEPVRKPPAWLAFLSEGLVSPPSFLTASASAVLLLSAHNRIFAITFGYGRTMLTSNARVRDFGVRVALNSIDPVGIKSIDMRRVEEMTIHTRRQVSRTADLTPFRIDERQDFLRSIGGRPIEELGWKGMVEGADSVAISLDIGFDELPDFCGQLLDLYESTDYLDHGFGFYDNLRLVTDPDDLAELQGKLDAALEADDTGGIHLSMPDAMDLGDINSYRYRGRGHPFDELDIDEMLAELQGAGIHVNTDWLEAHDLLVNYAGSPETDYSRCPLFDTLVFETRLDDDAVYVLSAGEWHRVSDDFVAEVENMLAGLPECALTLPDCETAWTEGEYNIAAAADVGCACMDAKNISFGGHDKVEFCDLLTTDGQFIHVKKRGKSSTLSHLFFQGLNSARLFLENPEFRGLVRSKIEEVSADHAHLVPDASPDTGQYEVVFGVIGQPGTQNPNALPFFSRLSMAETATMLADMGYRVSYAPIAFTAVN